MAKLTPKLPLLEDIAQPGFGHIIELRELVKQNMKMVLLTNPGERVMMPDFGVGIMQLLFENLSDVETVSYFQGRIKEQIQAHLPYVEIVEVEFDESKIDSNRVAIRLKYYIPSLEEAGVLTVGY